MKNFWSKLKKFFVSDAYNDKVKPEAKRFIAVIIFTGIYGIGMAWFIVGMDGGNKLYTGGIPGIGQLVIDFLTVRLNVTVDNPQFWTGIFSIVGNIPILIFGWFKVSKKFTIYSLVSVIIQFSVLGLIKPINTGLTGEASRITNAVLGGLLTGIGVGGTLRFGTSTGGFDIIAQYFSFKKGKSVGFFSMVLNLAIAIIGGFILGEFAVVAYTVIRIIVTTMATDKIHTSYQYLKVEIITDNPKELIDEIFLRLGRGVTTIAVQGAYSQHDKTMLYVVISSYEFSSIQNIAKRVDNKSFIVASPVRTVLGNFKRKTIA